MTNAELLKERLSSMASIMKEWAEESEKDQILFENTDERVSNWYKGRAQAYRMASDWLNEIIKG